MDFHDFLYELNGCISAPVPEFIDKYFGNGRVTSKATAPESLPSSKISSIQPASVNPDRFPQWFVNLAQTNRSGARGSWSVTAKDNTHHERGLLGDCTRLAFRLLNTDSGTVKDNAAVQAVGLVCPTNASYRDGLVALCASAQAVFYLQPTRLFLHAFYIRGSLVEFWVLDRSGVYCSKAMDVRQDAELFLSLFQYYEMMTDQELGMSSIFSTDDQGQYILLNENNGTADRLYVDTTPIVTRQTLIGAATVVYRAKLSGSDEWSHAVKIKWPSANARPENELLEIAMERKAWGAAKLVLYREYEITANLRRGMGCGEQRKLPSQVTAADEQNEETKTGNGDIPGVLQFTEKARRSFDSRTLVCVVTSPLGRPLHTFQTRLELLEALRDAIKCHRSLYLDAGLLHGDISPGNMIITDTPGAGQPRGILIDLEFAMPRDPAPKRDPNVTIGTLPFMAIGYMNGEAKTYRQDLEAFFYVLLHMIVGDRDMQLPAESRMQAWAQGGGGSAGNDAWRALADRKLRDMEHHSFRHIVNEIPPMFASVKALAERLRALLFPVRDGKVWAGTDHTPEAVEALYDGVIAAFDDVVAAET
ncbi:hypothetical protein BBAD15_g7714 [Beauveria bassiana D1-5]|uniref:Protein kinase domain-containing protein n=1 Tax=Beauveria bassiana D1-5 TaxID=1245745 RepID=A0A0A2W1Y0_BEABA|nr:hypothetical protein BBAD15_g7714 [Beauveria bassiana D1-5]